MNRSAKGGKGRACIPKAKAFSENFAGQWLQSRGVLDVPINSEVVIAAEAPPPVMDLVTFYAQNLAVPARRT